MDSTAKGFGIRDGLCAEMERSDILGTDGAKRFLYIKQGGSFELTGGFPESMKATEGIICWTLNLDVEPEEIVADFLKSDSAKEWIEFIAVRQFNRMYSLKAGLFVYAERV